MKFTVKFLSRNNYTYNFEEEAVGLDLINWLRKEIKDPKWTIDNINGHIRSRYLDIEVELSEDIARESQHFARCNHIVVHVDEDQLNDFHKYSYLYQADSYVIIHSFSTNEIIDFWRKNKFALDITTEALDEKEAKSKR